MKLNKTKDTCIIDVRFERDVEDDAELVNDPALFDQRMPLEARMALQLSRELQEAYDDCGIAGHYTVPALEHYWLGAPRELYEAQDRLDRAHAAKAEAAEAEAKVEAKARDAHAGPPRSWNDQPQELEGAPITLHANVDGRHIEVRKAGEGYYLTSGNLFGSQTIRCRDAEALLAALSFALRKGQGGFKLPPGCEVVP